MDNLTHLALGGATGGVLLGRQAGWRAVAWGALAGTLPDLDVVAATWLDPAAYFLFHRGPSHSLLAAAMAAPVLGLLAAHLHRSVGVDWRRWASLAWWALLGHILLDALTGYGTQLFWPFSSYRVEWNTIFVLDPTLTLPLMALTLIGLALIRRRPVTAHRLQMAALGWAVLYLTLTVTVRHHVEAVFQAAFTTAGHHPTRLRVTPTPLNILLWRGTIETPGGYRVAFHSLLDPSPPISSEFVAAQSERLDPWRHEPAVAALIEAADGFWCARPGEGDTIRFHDLRFGRLADWDGHPDGFVFTFLVHPTSNSPPRISRPRPDFRVDRSLLAAFVRRVLGQPTSVGVG